MTGVQTCALPISLGFVWGKYDQNVLDFERDWYILSFSYKWIGKKRVDAVALPDFKTLYKKDKEDDSALCLALWQLFNEADIIIAHNGDRFDIRKANARFLQHGFDVPEPYKTIDTLKIARRYFKFDSNKLDDLARYLGLGRKVNVGGFSTWKGCMNGDMASWRKMVTYNKMDVDLLEKVYIIMRPWVHNHVNINSSGGEKCPACGSTDVQKRGWARTRINRYQRVQCQNCGKWSRSTLAEKVNKPLLV